jgi:hypothetical protein
MSNRIRPIVVFDFDILKKAFEYYGLDYFEIDRKKLLNWECFSNPSLEFHECNYRALLPGKKSCEHCSNIKGRPCEISCDFQDFCLATYLWRLDVKTKDDLLSFLSKVLYEKDSDYVYSRIIELIANG